MIPPARSVCSRNGPVWLSPVLFEIKGPMPIGAGVPPIKMVKGLASTAENDPQSTASSLPFSDNRRP